MRPECPPSPHLLHKRKSYSMICTCARVLLHMSCLRHGRLHDGIRHEWLRLIIARLLSPTPAPHMLRLFFQNGEASESSAASKTKAKAPPPAPHILQFIFPKCERYSPQENTNKQISTWNSPPTGQ